MSDRDMGAAEDWNDLQMKLSDLALENDELKKQNQELAEVLRFYADKDNWVLPNPGPKPRWKAQIKWQDCAYYNAGGGRAREVLKKHGLLGESDE